MDLITRGRGAFLHDFAHKAPLTKIVHLENYNRQGEPLKKDEMIEISIHLIRPEWTIFI